MNRLTCPSLGCINAVVPSAGAGETGDKDRAILQFHTQRQKKYLHIQQLSFAGLAGLVTVFPPFSMTIFCYLPQKSPRASFRHFCSRFFVPVR